MNLYSSVSFLSFEGFNIIFGFYFSMESLKGNNIKNTFMHIKRHCDIILNYNTNKISSNELISLQASVDCLKRVINNEKSCPYIDIDKMF